MPGRLHTILTVLLLAIFIPSTFLMLRSHSDSTAGDADYREAIAIAADTQPQTAPLPETTAPAETTEATEAPTAPPEIRWIPEPMDETDPNLESLQDVDLEALQAVNPDVLGWILIPDTSINYPVLQSADNEYYLHHTWKKVRNSMGSIFLEWQNSPDFSDYNTIIYGHNMANGTMFASLRKYMKQSYYDAHPNVYLVTGQGIFCCEIFSSYQASVDSLTYGMKMQQSSSRRAFLEHCLSQSVIETTVEPTLTDQIITLSTCSGQGYDTRWVVHARLKTVPILIFEDSQS